MTPYTGNTIDEINQELKSKQIQIDSSLSTQTKDLLKSLLRRSSTERFDINQVLKHPALQSRLEEFKRSLTEAEKQLLFDNYIFNCGGSEVVEIPQTITNKSSQNALKVEPEDKKSVRMSERESYRKHVNKPLNNEFKNFFDDVIVAKVANSPKNETTTNFFDFATGSNFLKKAENEHINEFSLVGFGADESRSRPSNNAFATSLGYSTETPNLFANIKYEDTNTFPVTLTMNQGALSNNNAYSNQILQTKDSFFEIGEITESQQKLNQEEEAIKNGQEELKNSFFVNVPDETYDHHSPAIQQKPPVLVSAKEKANLKPESKPTGLNSNIPSAIFVNHALIATTPLQVPADSMVSDQSEGKTKQEEHVQFFSYEVHDINRSTILDNLQAQHDYLVMINQRSARDISLSTENDSCKENNSSDTPSEHEIKLNSHQVIFVNNSLTKQLPSYAPISHQKYDAFADNGSTDGKSSPNLVGETKANQMRFHNHVPIAPIIRRQTIDTIGRDLFNIAPQTTPSRFENAMFVNADLRVSPAPIPLSQTMYKDSKTTNTKDSIPSPLIAKQSGTTVPHKFL